VSILTEAKPLIKLGIQHNSTISAFMVQCLENARKGNSTKIAYKKVQHSKCKT